MSNYAQLPGHNQNKPQTNTGWVGRYYDGLTKSQDDSVGTKGSIAFQLFQIVMPIATSSIFNYAQGKMESLKTVVCDTTTTVTKTVSGAASDITKTTCDTNPT